MRISDWSSDVCSSDLAIAVGDLARLGVGANAKADDRRFRCSRQRHVRFRDAADARMQDAGTNLVGRDLVHRADEIGRASCRERVCRYVSISVVAVYLTKEP